jgi:hypothetical protein
VPTSLVRSLRHLAVALLLFAAAVVLTTEEVDASTGRVVEATFTTSSGPWKARAAVAPVAPEPGLQASWGLVAAAVAAAGMLRWTR